MTREDQRWRRADEILGAALEVDPGERSRWLDTACAGDGELRALVDRLLADACAPDNDLLPGGQELATSLLSVIPSRLADEGVDVGERIDRYRVLGEIGRGGMAVVYLAERADGQFEQRVALKLIKRGIDTDEVMRRFHQERQIMALASHPNIARLLDGGASEDGRPYFVMEYVDGLPIDEFCDGRRLSVRARLELFAQAAAAVSYAHRNLVVHRDIKPSNILVTSDGVVKLLDFGIARYLDPQDGSSEPTRTERRFLTPAYASPEQIGGQPVTTASDVYQLGLLLFRMLTGRQPYRSDDLDPEALRRAVCEETPTRPSLAVTGDSAVALGQQRGTTPSALRRELSGDLDNIVLTALRKEPERRYPSVAQLIDDIRRYLEGRPVTARPDTLTYRSSKFVRRHKLAVGFGLSGLLFLVAFAVTMTVQAGLISRERDRANLQARAAERVAEFLVGLFEVADPGEARGNTITARELLDRGAQRVERELRDDPLVRATMMDTIGRVYQNLGLYEPARPLLENALDTRRELLGEGHPDAVLSLNNVAWLLESAGNYEAAEPYYRRVLELRRTTLGDDHLQVATSLNNLGLLLYHKGEFDEAEPLLRRALEIRRRAYRGAHTEIADTLGNLGLLLHQKGDYTGAEALHRESLDMRRALLGEDHPHVAISLNNIALAVYGRGDLEGAEALHRDALELRRRIFGDVHPAVAESLNNLASVLYMQGDLAAAEPIFRQVVELDGKLLGENHPDRANSIGNLGMLLYKMERYEEAEAQLRDAVTRLERAVEPEHWLLGVNRSNHGAALTRLGRYEEAEAELRVAHSVLAAALGTEHTRTVGAVERLVELYDSWGRPAEAARYRELLPAP